MLTQSTTDRIESRLKKLLARPQRHRLLHGYPLAAAMPFANQEVRTRAVNREPGLVHHRNSKAPLLVGVLPHPFCNPKVKGCGYCTFPHEMFTAAKGAAVTDAVVQEIDQRLKTSPVYQNATVDGLYFGGGTANLTPAESFRKLASKLNDRFDLTDAEISLEGVPSRFVHGKTLLLDIMQEEIEARHFRISMGIQTFSEPLLKQMGRLGFGKPSTFASVVKAAHARSMTCSGDLLFNLPGQSLAEMQGDVQQAIDIGLDQICLYHLVMFRGLGSVWSRDEQMVSRLPDNEQAAENWLVLREYLINNGYQQTSLTNFEKRELKSDPRRYRYEAISYESLTCDVLGFGPAGISYSQSPEGRSALKTMNPEGSAEYLQAVQSQPFSWNRFFQYEIRDIEMLYLTRRLAALQIDFEEFGNRFGELAWSRYAEIFDVLTEKRFLERRAERYRLTPKGMFFSDSIAGLLAGTVRTPGDGKEDGDGDGDGDGNNNGKGYM